MECFLKIPRVPGSYPFNLICSYEALYQNKIEIETWLDVFILAPLIFYMDSKKLITMRERFSLTLSA